MKIKPLAGLTKMLCVLIKISIVVTAIAILAGIYHYHTYATLPTDVDPNEIFLPCDAVSGFVGLIQSGLYLFLLITFFRWIYRTNKNLGTLSGEQMVFTPGWSVGWYFIPIANLFKPYQVMKEIWNVSHKNQSTTYPLIGWWWLLWITSNFLAHIALKLTMKATDTESYIASAITYIVSDGIDLILYIVELMLVTRIGMAYSTNIIEQTGTQNEGNAGLPSPSII